MTDKTESLFKQNVRKYNEVKAQIESEGFEIAPNGLGDTSDWRRVFYAGEAWKMESRRPSPFSVNVKTGERRYNNNPQLAEANA